VPFRWPASHTWNMPHAFTSTQDFCCLLKSTQKVGYISDIGVLEWPWKARHEGSKFSGLIMLLRFGYVLTICLKVVSATAPNIKMF